MLHSSDLERQFLREMGASGAGLTDLLRDYWRKGKSELRDQILPIWERLKDGWVLVNNGAPVIAPESNGVYYPTFLYRPGYSYEGEKYNFILWCTNKSTYDTEVYLSKDFESWTGPVGTTGLSGYHSCAVYVDGDEKPYKMAQWIDAEVEPRNKWCESADGLSWTSQDFAQQSPPNAEWNNVTYGICHLNYNPNATNKGSDPRDYKFWGFQAWHVDFVAHGCYRGEWPLPVWSADGVNWTNSIAEAAVTLSSAKSRQHSTRMSVCQLGGGDWIGFANLGDPDDANYGLHLIYSENGVFFEVKSWTPHKQFGDALLGDKYEIECPCIRRVDNKLYLVWMGQTGESSSTRSIFAATYDLS